MFDDFFDVLEDSPFAEKPVDVRTFVEGKDFLGQPSLSVPQYDIVEGMSQIYKIEELQELMGFEEGSQYYKKFTKNEIILQLGKGTNIGSTMAWSPEYGYKRIDRKLEDFGLIQSRGVSNGATAFYSEGDDDVFTITTKHGYSFTGNLSHKFLGWKNSPHGVTYASKKDPSYLEISDIEVGDIAMIYGNWDEPTSPYELSYDEAKLIGYMIGDGSWMRNTVRNPMFTNATKEVQEDVLRIIKNLGGRVVHTVSGKGCWQIRINGINSWFQKHGLSHDYNEKKPWNPEWINMSSVNLAGLIQGLWATDGWGSIQKRDSSTSTQLGLELNSESLCAGVHSSLLRLGILSKFSAHRKSRNDEKHSPTWRVAITHSKHINRFISLIGTPLGKSECFDNILEITSKIEYANLKKNGDEFRDRIISIEHAGSQEVFACTVESGHNYLGNGFIHGNSGKDYTSTVAVCYIVYKLLCLKDPAVYYGKPSGDAIDIINIAINATQAKNVFFKGFKTKVERSPWFAGKYYSKMDSIEFPHSVTVYSGHSERESHEGLNLLVAILDEISGFAVETATGNEQGKTADNIYKAFRGSVDSRFPDLGKVVLLSFPRYPGDFISTKYESAIMEKEVVERTHKFILNPDLPEDSEGNTLEITWDEDHIVSYNLPGVYALKRPTWEINPTRKIEDFKLAFYTDLNDAMMRFACDPKFSSDAFFKQHDKLRSSMSARNPLDEFRRLEESFHPRQDVKYYVHADLAQKHDKCAVAIAHVEKWVSIQVLKDLNQVVPVVVVDFVAWWEPKVEGPVNLSEVKQWIQNLRRLGFDLGMVTFDRWNSFDIQNELKKVGIRTDTVSVAKKHYEDMAMLVYEDRLIMPGIELLFEELTQLKIMKNNRVDHPRKSSKDLADAVCGAIYGAIVNTPREDFGDIEIHTYKSRPKTEVADLPDNVIQYKNKPIPDDIQEYLDMFSAL